MGKSDEAATELVAGWAALGIQTLGRKGPMISHPLVATHPHTGCSRDTCENSASCSMSGRERVRSELETRDTGACGHSGSHTWECITYAVYIMHPTWSSRPPRPCSSTPMSSSMSGTVRIKESSHLIKYFSLPSIIAMNRSNRKSSPSIISACCHCQYPQGIRKPHSIKLQVRTRSSTARSSAPPYETTGLRLNNTAVPR